MDENERLSLSIGSFSLKESVDALGDVMHVPQGQSSSWPRNNRSRGRPNLKKSASVWDAELPEVSMALVLETYNLNKEFADSLGSGVDLAPVT